MIVLDSYTDKERDIDFDFFLSNYDELFQKYGKCFLAIRDRQILGSYLTVREAIDDLAPEYPLGSYILQECDGTENAYTTRIMGVKIDA